MSVPKPAIHIVSFQNPSPPNYGGVIDVYYKIKSLHDAGWRVILHTFAYNGRENITDDLSSIAEVKVYNRRMGILPNLSSKPYIVNSRINLELLRDLCEDDYPILFEGIHCCGLLNHPDLKQRLKIVRAHNVEHDYYRGLAKATTNTLKRLYYNVEAAKLRRFEPILSYADMIAAISVSDLEYFSNRYGSDKCFLLPPFFEEINSEVSKREKFVLYQGRLDVAENILAVSWIIDNIASALTDVKFVIAGANPDSSLIEKAYQYHNVEIKPSPTIDEMNSLVSTAQVSLMITFQSTGIKLKLLSAICNGGFVIANNQMVSGSGLSEYCDVADDAKDICQLIKHRLDTPMADKPSVPDSISNRGSANILMSKISERSVSDYL